jgi:putative ABC transport system permease protein
MNLREGIRLALEQLRQDKLKSAFGLLGVIIGVFFLIIVVSVVEGVDRYVTEDLASEFLGINTIQVRRIPQVQIEVDPAQRREWNRRPRLHVDDAEAIRRGLTVPALVGVESGTSAEMRGPRGRSIDNVQLSLVSTEILEIRRLEIVRGRPFSPQEADLGVPVVILGSAVAEGLFQGVDPLGGRVRIRGFPFRVVGILEERGNMLGQSLDNVAIVPAESPARAFLARPGNVNGIVIQTLDPADIEVALGEAEAALRVERRLRPSEPSDFDLETADDSLAFWDRISTVLFLALPGLVGISLVVGGIVIMNIMLVSVIERTREVGVRMALGARRKDILMQFVIEAAFLSGTGAIIGTGIGIAVTSIVQTATPLPAAVAPQWVAVGVLLGVSVGLVAGVYPAVRASKMDPVEALRYE